MVLTSIPVGKRQWVIRCQEDRHVAFCGRDGYWTRHIKYAMPFTDAKALNIALAREGK